MNKTKQTAVEWLIDKIYNHPENPLDAHIQAYFEEAKQMEKEKMIDFAEISRIKKDGSFYSINDLYNKKYGGNK